MFAEKAAPRSVCPSVFARLLSSDGGFRLRRRLTAPVWILIVVRRRCFGNAVSVRFVYLVMNCDGV